jgi:indole-3-glycerol phosphate synthase
LGSEQIFAEVRRVVALPMLRKDFTVSEYQLYESKLLGANAVLLIMAITEEARAKDYLSIAKGLGMSVLCECRSGEEIELAQKIGAQIVGVNNRDLHDFSVDGGKAASLRPLVERDRVFVSESGILSLDDLKQQKELGADSCLVGEFCMKAQDRVRLLREMKDV